MLSEIYKGKFTNNNIVETFGEKYEDSMIGKTINYTSGKNNVTDWIILGKQGNAQGKNDVIITTKNPVSAQEIQLTLEEWTEYETKINNACKNYIGETGMLGLKTFTAKEVRSITIEDINNTVGFSETINPVTLGGTSNDFAYPKDDGSGWIVKGTDENYTLWSYPIETYFYFDADGYKFSSATNHFSDVSITLGRPNCMKYIMANNTAYWVSSRCVDLRTNPQFNVFTIGYGPIGNGTNFCSSNVSGGNNRGGTGNMSLRPIVVISSETPWDDVKDLIGNYATYN